MHRGDLRLSFDSFMDELSKIAYSSSHRIFNPTSGSFQRVLQQRHPEEGYARPAWATRGEDVYERNEDLTPDEIRGGAKELRAGQEKAKKRYSWYGFRPLLGSDRRNYDDAVRALKKLKEYENG